MSFYIYDIIFLLVFFAVAGIFLYINRKNLKFEKPLLLYRTKVGLKVIDYISKKFEKQLKILSYAIIAAGYILMIFMVYLLVQIIYIYFKFPAVVRAVKIPPFMPLVPYITEIFNVHEIFPPFYFTYWIIAVAIIAVFHESAHGIFARLNKIRVKSTGFGFLGPFLAAFVEPDEKQIKKKSRFAQLSVLSAGSFANIVMALIFLLIMWLFFALAFAQSGAIFNTYTYSFVNITSISSIDNKMLESYRAGSILDSIIDINKTLIEVRGGNRSYVTTRDILTKQLNTTEEIDEIMLYDDAPAIRSNMSGAIIEIDGIKIKNAEDLGDVLSRYNPGDSIITKTESKNKTAAYTREYAIVLAENPENKSRAFLGIGIIGAGRGFFWGIRDIFMFKSQSTYYKPKIEGLSDFTMFIYNLLWWIVLINFGVGLFNMLPVGIFDGGQVFYLTVLGITKSEKIAKKAFSIATKIILLMFLLLVAFWIFAFR